MVDYSSKLGSILYYDSVAYGKCLCEPTMLFLLGLEAITTSNDDSSLDKDSINKLILYKDNIGDIFDDVVDYLKYCYKGKLISVSDEKVVFNCRGIKLFMNDKTGTDTNRICPVIMHDSKEESFLGDIDDSDKYNILAEKISDIFNNAGYNISDNELQFKGKSFITDKDVISSIDEYNSELLIAHNKKKADRDLYKLIDYKAMYSYALGVLYGCECTGFDSNAVWRFSPSDWYDGEYKNLVNTAYEIFKFHYKHAIPRIDSDNNLFKKYKGIQINKIWNFDNDSADIKSDEKSCYSLYIDNNGDTAKNLLLYSKSVNSYRYMNSNSWQSLDNEVISDSNPKKGIVHKCDSSIIRYIANNEVELSKAYEYSKGKFLSPNKNETYFCYTGDLGWVSFSENSWKLYSDDNPVLTFAPLGFNKISSDSIKLALNKESGELSPYYECYVSGDNKSSSHRSLYGVLSHDSINGGVVTVDDDEKFEHIFSDEYFESHYEYPAIPQNCTLTEFYNLGNKVSVCVSNEDTTLIWNGGNTYTPIIDFGYTSTESSQLNTFVDLGNNTPATFDLRFNEDLGYWSNTWEPKQWQSQFEDTSVYEYKKGVSLYRNIDTVANDINCYTQFVQNAEDEYIFNNDSVNLDLNHGFVTLSSVHDLGITTHPCEIIYTDDFGNSLLDSNDEPLVWYDNETGLYWNSVHDANIWQSEKPSIITVTVYDSLNNVIKTAYDKHDDRIIILDNEYISYEQFYSHSNNGVIRDTLYVFDSEAQFTDVVDCYYDSYSDEYCIPNITDEWVSRQYITDRGYIFVDGTEQLYINCSEISLIYNDEEVRTRSVTNTVRRYYYSWSWKTYDELYNEYGITKEPQTAITLYDSNLVELVCWQDQSDNVWVDKDGQWYSLSEVPYYSKSDEQSDNLYMINMHLYLDVYEMLGQIAYNYNNFLRSYQYLYDNFGITQTQSQVYFASNGVIKCWYNQYSHLYWDDESKQWQNYPPRYEEGGGSIIDVEDINSIGACGLFTYYNPAGTPKAYGSIVSASYLKPVCIKFPSTGEIECKQMSTEPLTGSWRLLSAVPATSLSEPCVVFAMRISNETINQDGRSVNVPNNATTYVEYEF